MVVAFDKGLKIGHTLVIWRIKGQTESLRVRAEFLSKNRRDGDLFIWNSKTERERLEENCLPCCCLNYEA